MYEFTKTRWGQFQLRLVLALLFIMMLVSSGTLIWVARNAIGNEDEFSMILFAVLAPLALWLSLLFQRALTSFTLAYFADGIVYRTLWGQHRMFAWTDIVRVRLQSSGSDLDSIERHFYDGKLDLYGYSRSSRGGTRKFPKLTIRISIPLSVYTHPEYLLAYIAHMLCSDDENHARPGSLSSVELAKNRDVLLDEAYRLAQSRGQLNKEMRELASQLNSYEHSLAYWRIQRWKHVSTMLGLMFLCMPFWLFCLLNDSLKFMNWKHLTLQLPMLFGMTLLILAAYFGYAASAFDSAPTERVRPWDRQDDDF